MNESRDLLIVIDMQNVYLPDRDWACPHVPEAAYNIRRLIDSGRYQTVFTRFDAPVDPVGIWKTYNTEYREINEDPDQSAIIDSLADVAGQYPMYSKSTYSSMTIPELRELALKADRVILTGVVAECCVLATMIDAIDLGCKVVYVTDAVAGQNEEHEAAVETVAHSFSPMHTLVTDTDHLL